MEEEDTIIIQVVFRFDDGRIYTFDVDRTTTLNETKKILSNAAHMLRNTFTIYHDRKEYSREYDDQMLYKLFPTLKKIEFFLKLKKCQEESEENEHEQISVKYNIKQPCKEHMGKFLVLYCISCKKSICNECFSLFHSSHEVEEKADYLMPAKILMERIFSDSFMYKSDSKISNYMSCVSFRSIVKTEIFDKMRQLINELENKCINCLEFFSFTEDSTEKNNDLNLELLKKYCTASFIKLKNNIDTKDILINDEVFLSLYNKLKSIKDYKTRIFSENINKYKAINQYFVPFTQEIQNMSVELNNILVRHIKNDIYSKFKEDISKNFVDVIQKEEVNKFMFEKINVAQCGPTMINTEDNLIKSCLTQNYSEKLLPSIFAESKQNHNVNINLSRTNANITNNLDNIVTSTPTETVNNRSSNLLGSIRNNVTSNIPINNTVNYQYVQQKYTTSSPVNYSNTNNNIYSNNMNILSNPKMNLNSFTIDKNINTNTINESCTCRLNSLLNTQTVSEFNKTTISMREERIKDKNEKMEVEESGETHPTQNSPIVLKNDINYSQVKLDQIKTNYTDKKKICTSPTSKNKRISVNLSPNKKEGTISSKCSKNSATVSNSIQQKNFYLQKDSKEKIRDNINSAKCSKSKNCLNNVNLFNGKLIDVLNKEKIRNEKIIEILNGNKEKEKKLSQENQKKVTSKEKTKTCSKTNIFDKCVSKKTETTQSCLNSKTTKKVIKTCPIAFMYPVFKTNLIKAAIDKNTVQEIKINFSDFSKDSPIINEFPNGGTYCNYKNCLYFTGGQEYIKGAGKLFLAISNNSLVQNAIKLPSMKYNHWNHSMIANKGKIYVIGGYNTNKCEYYDIAEKTWKEMPNLIENERQRSMLFIEKNYLYCFMGLNQSGILNTVERINLDNIDEGWENIIVVNSNHINLKFYGSGIIRMNNANKIYFVGGKKENKKKETCFKRTIYEFSFDNNEIAVSDFKIENDLFFIENRLYAMDATDCGNFINVGNGFLISMPNLVK